MKALQPKKLLEFRINFILTHIINQPEFSWLVFFAITVVKES